MTEFLRRALAFMAVTNAILIGFAVGNHFTY